MKHVLLDNIQKKLVIEFKKKGRDEKKDFYIALSEELDTSARNLSAVNVYKLDSLAKKHKEKIFLVPGTVLGFGTLSEKVKVYAYKFSHSAIEKIKALKGETKTFEELLKDKVEAKDIMIVK